MNHEYSVLGGINRAAIGRHISMVAAVVATALGALAAWLLDIAQRFGLADHVPPLVLWPLTAGLIYTALYWLFDRHIWRHGRVAKLLKVPDLAGTWVCEGVTLYPPEIANRRWQARVVIVQSWDRIRVHLSGAHSSSSSVAAALVYDEAAGYRLLYNYKNEPRLGQDLVAHRGSAELVFDPDCKTGEGEYFNGHGRYTYGTMKLTRQR